MTNSDAWRDREFMQKAIAAVDAALTKCPNAIPIGAALVIDGESEPRSVGKNQRVQRGSSVLHGETDCVENAGLSVSIEEYARATLYTTLSPCLMCAGTILRFNIPRVVIAENSNFEESELLLRVMGVEVNVLDDENCRRRMRDFIDEFPDVWNGDITDVRKSVNERRRKPVRVGSKTMTPEIAFEICKSLEFIVPSGLELVNGRLEFRAGKALE